MARVVTLDDVAARVGVSARTVSRVVNGQGGCTDETRERIVAAIAELGYRPNMLARGLITRRSDTVALVVAEMSDPYFIELAESVERAARARRRTMFLASTGNDADQQRSVMDTLVSHGVDGVILFPAANTNAALRSMAASGLPIVTMDVAVEGTNIGSVVSNLADGARQAVEHLLAQGRRRIGMVTDTRAHEQHPNPRREGAFRATLRAAGHSTPDSLIARGTNNIEGGVAATLDLLAHHPDLDAIFAYNDLMAIGALRTLQQSGRKVPDDVAVVGFDDIELCRVLTPQLSSVRLDRDQLGQRAVELLHRMIDERFQQDEPDVVDVTLIPRESS